MQFRVNPDSLELFENSLHRCTSREGFFERFYSAFLSDHEEITQRFAHVDMKRQARILKGSLYFVARAAGGLEDGTAHLNTIARSHDKSGYDIKPEFYDHWLGALVETVAATDPLFDETIRQAWMSTLGPCIEVMTSHWRRDH